jgi:hypothetical protein
MVTLYVFVFAAWLIFACLPGIIMGLPIGMFVRARNGGWTWCIVATTVATAIYAAFMRAFEPQLTIIWLALFVWVLVGRWAGGMIRPPAL